MNFFSYRTANNLFTARLRKRKPTGNIFRKLEGDGDLLSPVGKKKIMLH